MQNGRADYGWGGGGDFGGREGSAQGICVGGEAGADFRFSIFRLRGWGEAGFDGAADTGSDGEVVVSAGGGGAVGGGAGEGEGGAGRSLPEFDVVGEPVDVQAAFAGE